MVVDVVVILTPGSPISEERTWAEVREVISVGLVK